MPTNIDQTYSGLRADDRLEVRLPAILKQHAELVASARNKTVSEFVLSVLVEAVEEGLPEIGTWQLTLPEQAELLKLLAAPATQTPAMTAARENAEALFGPATLD